MVFKSIHRIFTVAFCLSLVAFIDSSARAASPATNCTLIASGSGTESLRDWQTLGFEVQSRPSLSTPEAARLLNDSTFALVREGTKSEFWVSLTRGKVTPQWAPIVLAAPAPGAPIASNYACQHLRSNMDFLRTSREGLKDLYRLTTTGQLTRTRGEIILDAEQSFFIHQGVEKYRRSDAKQTYLALLAAARPLAQRSAADFYESWNQVRSLVFSAHQTHISYCRGKSSLTEALVDKCTNCVGETYLLAALFMDAGFRPPTGWSLRLQLFEDHLRPILASEADQRTYDLVTGARGEFKAAILEPNQLFVQLWRGHQALRHPLEQQKIELISPSYLFRAEGCEHAPIPQRPRLQASSWAGVQGCGRFSPHPPPEFADNTNKADAASVDEDETPPGPNAPTPNSAPVSADSDGATGSLGRWVPSGAADSDVFEYLSEELTALAKTLIPSERDALLASVRKKKLTPEAVKLFSLRTMIQDLGFSVYLQSGFVENPNLGETGRFGWTWSSTYWPVHFELSSAERHRDCGWPLSGANPTGSLLPFACVANEPEIRKVYLFDPDFYAQIRSLSSGQRERLFYQKMAALNQSLVENRVQPFLLAADKSPLEKALNAKRELGALQKNLESLRVHVLDHLKYRRPLGLSYVDDESLGRPLIRHPLRQATLTLSGANQLQPVLDLMVRLSEPLADETLNFVSALEAASPEKLNQINESLRTWSDLVNGLNGLAKSEPRLLTAKSVQAWTSLPDYNQVQNRFLIEILTHPLYFFTTPASEGDGPSGTGGLAGPALNLPTVAGTKTCQPDQGPLQLQVTSGIFIECGSSALGGRAAVRDSRQERPLQDSTWRALLTSTEGLHADTSIKILLHHAYRSRLWSVLGSLETRLQLMTFDPADLTDETAPLALALDESTLARERPLMMSAAEIHGRLWTKPYFQAALGELRTLKPGYKRLLAHGLMKTNADVLRGLIAYHPADPAKPAPERGQLPLFYESPTGEWLSFLGSSDNSIYRALARSPELKEEAKTLDLSRFDPMFVSPGPSFRRFLGSHDLRQYPKRSGDNALVSQSRSSVFSKRRAVYYFAGDKPLDPMTLQVFKERGLRRP